MSCVSEAMVADPASSRDCHHMKTVNSRAIRPISVGLRVFGGVIGLDRYRVSGGYGDDSGVGHRGQRSLSRLDRLGLAGGRIGEPLVVDRRSEMEPDHDSDLRGQDAQQDVHRGFILVWNLDVDECPRQERQDAYQQYADNRA